MRTSTKIGLLSSLYLSQGLPYGFFTQALPTLLREQGMSLPGIGLTYLLLFDVAGWRPTLLSLGTMLLLATLPVLLYRSSSSRRSAGCSGESASQALGYTGHFLLSAVLCAVGTLYVLLTFHPPRTLAAPGPSEASS